MGRRRRAKLVSNGIIGLVQELGTPDLPASSSLQLGSRVPARESMGCAIQGSNYPRSNHLDSVNDVDMPPRRIDTDFYSLLIRDSGSENAVLTHQHGQTTYLVIMKYLQVGTHSNKMASAQMAFD
jgi:hypothetical protein